MAIEWTSDLNTGIDVIDDQHKRIVDYINQLENAVSQKDSRSVGLVLDALADYCLAHFGFEESLQEKAGYALAKPHKVIHETFAKRLARYREKHNAGEDVAQQLHDMLKTWLLHHIKRDDMAYVSVVKGGIDRMSRDKNDGDWLSRSVKGFFN
ncbi:MAG: bacteriohemerythrin [Rhodocyclales bacterium]|nr:bacteriohemerythrin [Rhodocyclales bacterium]